MDRSAQNSDCSSECEIMNLRRMKFVFDVAPLEIIDNKDDEDFIYGGGGGGVVNINQIDLVMQIIDHGFIFQHWSLKSDQQQKLNSSSSSSSCHDQYHRNHHHHLRDDDNDHNEEDMSIMISCQPSCPDPELPCRLIFDRGIFASHENHHQKAVITQQEDVNQDDHSTDDDYIMSQLYNVDALYESERIDTYEHLVEVKRCIVQRISEAKPAVLLAKPKTVRIRVDLSTILKMYYANSAAAASAAAQYLAELRIADELYSIHYPDSPSQLDHNDEINNIPRPAAALRSSREALEVKIFEKEDLISSSSSCSVCLNEFRVGVDKINKMPCSHVFHVKCLMSWLWERNTCPLCGYELPTFSTHFYRPEDDQLPCTKYKHVLRYR